MKPDALTKHTLALLGGESLPQETGPSSLLPVWWQGDVKTRSSCTVSDKRQSGHLPLITEPLQQSLILPVPLKFVERAFQQLFKKNLSSIGVFASTASLTLINSNSP